MGRSLALGIATDIYIRKKASRFGSNNFDLHNNFELLKSKFNDILDISKYEWNETDSGYVLEMDMNYIIDNIHDLVKELYPLIDCRYFILGDSDIELDDKFNSKDYPLVLKRTENRYEKFENNWNLTDSGSFYCTPEYMLLCDDKIAEMVHFDVDYILLWCDWAELDSENETKLLKIMNKISRSYWKSPLSKNILFFIDG